MVVLAERYVMDRRKSGWDLLKRNGVGGTLAVLIQSTFQEAHATMYCKGCLTCDVIISLLCTRNVPIIAVGSANTPLGSERLEYKIQSISLMRG